MKQSTRTDPVRIVDFEKTKVAALEHRGAPELMGETIRRFIEWRRRNELPSSISATFNVIYDHPETGECHYDICAAVDRNVPENDYGVVTKTIPAGRCAVLRHIGSDDTLAETIRWLYAEWLPKSGEAPRDFPLFLERVRFFPDVPEHEAVTDVFLPLASPD